MNWTKLLFSFRGRVNRGKYWLAILMYTIIALAYIAALFQIADGFNNDSIIPFVSLLFATAPAASIFGLVMTWSSFAVSVKRLHDRNKNGWWVLLLGLGPSVFGGAQTVTTNPVMAMIFGFVSFALVIWGFVELGCLRGTSGANQYGADPLGGFSSEPLR